MWVREYATLIRKFQTKDEEHEKKSNPNDT